MTVMRVECWMTSHRKQSHGSDVASAILVLSPRGCNLRCDQIRSDHIMVRLGDESCCVAGMFREQCES